MTTGFSDNSGNKMLLRARCNSCGKSCLDDLGAPAPYAWTPPRWSVELTSQTHTSLQPWQPTIASPILALMPVCSDKFGDMNCDNVVNSLDIDPFVLAITNPPAYEDQYPDCDIWLADLNCDGALNALDVDLLVELLTGG